MRVEFDVGFGGKRNARRFTRHNVNRVPLRGQFVEQTKGVKRARSAGKSHDKSHDGEFKTLAFRFRCALRRESAITGRNIRARCVVQCALMMRSFLLCLFLLIGVAPRADAFSRAYRPVGDYVRESPLVIVADIATQDANPFATILTIREVLKTEDDSIVAGGQIKIPLGISRWIVPREAQNALVVMAPSGKRETDNGGLRVSEVYQTPEQIFAARALIAVYRAPDERARLLALQQLAGQNNKFLDEQLLADLSRIRNRDNFDVALESYDRLETENRVNLIQLLGTIGDARALPLLIAATRAPDAKIWRAAIAQLTYRFPDAPGLNEALRALLADAERRPFVLDYLAQRDPNVPTRLSQMKPTTWMRARSALESGDTVAARAALFAVIDQDAEPKYGFSTIMAARELIPLAQTEADKTRLRGALFARLQTNSDYLSITQIIELLRQLPAPENIAALLPVLAPPPDTISVFTWHQPAREATFALLELGAQARQNATAFIVKSLRARAAGTPQMSDHETAIYSFELAWLADDATWKSAAQISPAIARQLAQTQPLRDAAQSKNEAQALAALLPDTNNQLQNRSDLWIIARLGELGDGVAVAPMLAELKRAPYAGRDQEFKRALLQIGGASARDGALELMDFPEPSQRVVGMDVLRELPDFDVRPLLLKILAGQDVSDKTHAIFLLGYVGTPQDLPVLEKLADFWTTDLAYQSRALDAIAGIRERYAQAK